MADLREAVFCSAQPRRQFHTRKVAETVTSRAGSAAGRDYAMLSKNIEMMEMKDGSVDRPDEKHIHA